MLHDPTHLGEPESSEDEDVEEESELKKMESEVKEMAERIIDYRTNLPDKLTTSLASLTSALRTHFESHPDSPEAAKFSEPATLSESDRSTTEEVIRLKEKISTNIALMPIVLKRMKECISKTDNLQSADQDIHPVFKRKKTS